jgi:hypothetical protein
MDSDEEQLPCKTVKKTHKYNSLKKLAHAWMIGTQPAEIAFANDKTHVKTCKEQNCVRCAYVNRRRALAKECPMLPANMNNITIAADKLHLSKGCWLASATVDGVWGLGCIVCSAHNLPGPFGTFTWRGVNDEVLKIQKLDKHQTSQEHRRAVAAYFGVKDLCLAAPPAAEMLEQCRSLMKGGAVFGSTKLTAMTWCLREAVLDIDRDFVRRAKTLCICRDDRAGRLLMRFVGATTNLDVRSGVLGIGTLHREKPDADMLVAATKAVFEEFCTPRKDAPTHGDGPYHIERPANKTATSSSSLDVELLEHLKNIVEVIAVDEAADEAKAVDIGRGRRSSALELEPITPNLKFTARDKAHGFRKHSK